MPFTDLQFLVAEDHDFQRLAMVRLLENLGAKSVLAAPDGHVALGMIQDGKHPVDVVICDLDMPGMDGMEFIRHLGEARLPVSVILTSALDRNLIASVEKMTEAYGIELLGVVEKPISPGKLRPLLLQHHTMRAKLRGPGAASPSFTLEEVAAGLRDNQFEPFFQPKIELSSNRVKGAEALARWRHPHKGIVAPYAFIKLLEDNGMIDELMWVMLRKAAAICSAWRAAGLESTVSVNLSLRSLSDLHLADRVTEIVHGQNIEPRHMVLEVTESAATTDVGRALENLARLRMKGYGLSIDDYGTGYSSMQQLTRIAFTELKIDQSFVTNAAKLESARVILGSSLEMAKKLNIASVAEGVESEADWNLLRHLGCSIVQGYFIAKPMDAESYLEWARGWKQCPLAQEDAIPTL